MKNLYILLFSSFFLFIFSSLNCQDTINRTDQKGLKQGYWMKKYPNGKKQYEGYFTDNRPSGTFKRYFDNDTLMSVMLHKPDGKTAEATLYHRNGFIASKGIFVDQKKEGKWIFYSAAIKNYLLMEELYSGNRKEGVSTKFYPSGAILEKITYRNDKKDGEWNQFYPDGKLCLKAYYKDGKLEGSFETWFPDGKPMFKGQYSNDARNGDWIIYSKEGKVKEKTAYINGISLDPDRLKKESEYLDRLEKNRGLIEDPEKSSEIYLR